MRHLHALLILVILTSPLVTLAAESGTNQIISPDDASARTTSVVAKVMFTERTDDLHVVWVEDGPSGSDVYYYKYNNASQKWSTGLALTEGAQARNAAISGDYKGNLHCAWEDQGSIWHRMWNVTSEEWDEPYLISDNAINPVVVSDRSPNTHVIWIQKADSSGQSPAYLSHRILDSYGEWSEPTSFSPENAYSCEAAMGVDQRNGLHVVWKMAYDPDKPFDMFYAYRQAGRDWSPFERILDGSDRIIENPSIAADKDNFAHVVWGERSQGASQIYYRAWKGSWEEPMQLTESAGSAANPVIATDDGLNIHVLWEDTRDHLDSNTPEIYYKRLWPLGIWSSPQRLTDDHVSSESSTPPRIEVSSKTWDLNVVWSETRDGKSRVFHRIWPGKRREDASRAASRARSEISEIERQPFVSSKANEKYDLALAAYEDGLNSLKEFNVPEANAYFLQCRELIDEGHLLEEEYKEEVGRKMGMALLFAGAIGAVVIIIIWLVLRNQQF